MTGTASNTFQVYRPVLPHAARHSPHRMVFTGDADGRCEVFAWDARTATARRVTDRPHGTLHCAIGPDGTLWWFDEDLDGTGVWRTQDFAGGPDHPAMPGLPAGRPRGLALGDDGAAAVGLADGGGLAVHLGRRGAPAGAVVRTAYPASLVDVCPDGRLLALAGGAATERAAVLVTSAGEVLATVPGTGGKVWPLGFATAGAGGEEPELLLVVQDADHYRVATWTPRDGLRHAGPRYDTEITARWYPGRREVLVRQDRHGRSDLTRLDLDRGTGRRIATAPGSVLDAAPRGDGDVHYLWTDSVSTPRAVSTGGTALPTAFGEPPAVPGRLLERWTPGPDGPVHTLVTVPDSVPGPFPVVFLVHGGPADHDRDAYDPAVHSLVEAGVAVARVNYRGSTGYGPRWRAAFTAGVGLTQVDDLAAARAHLVDDGLADPDATALWGTSWGGYLALLALGVRPDAWSCGIAVKPIADCALAFRDGTPALRALDTALFGGTPQEVPDAYARSSPSSYAAAVRAPLLVVAARHDVKCPPAQVEAYLAALEAHGVRHESLWVRTGHDGYDGRDHVEILRRSLIFLARHLRGRREREHDVPPGLAAGREG